MKVSFDISQELYDEIIKNGKKNGRSMAGEIRFQLTDLYGLEK